MLILDQLLVSEEIFEKKFVCNLSKCKGECCIAGDSGAPVKNEEIKQLEAEFENYRPYLTENGIKRIEKNGSVVNTSVDTFMEYLQDNANLFRLLLREKTGVSQQFRTAIRAEIDHFIVELADDLKRLGENKSRPISNAKLVRGINKFICPTFCSLQGRFRRYC